MDVLIATGITDYLKRFMPLQALFHHMPVLNCYRCPYGWKDPDCGEMCTTVLEGMILAEDTNTVAAFIAELVIDEGGIIISSPPNYYQWVREIIEKYGMIYVADEIITSFGRTRTWFGIEHWRVEPDMITMGKGMTGGYLPLFATAVRDSIYQTFVDSGEILFHGFACIGVPTLSVAALKALQIIEEENLL